jgi:hypothetical protein
MTDEAVLPPATAPPAAGTAPGFIAGIIITAPAVIVALQQVRRPLLASRAGHRSPGLFFLAAAPATPRSPISRSTVHRTTLMPSRFSSRQTFHHHTPGGLSPFESFRANGYLAAAEQLDEPLFRRSVSSWDRLTPTGPRAWCSPADSRA